MQSIKHLKQAILESLVNEGGQSGHLKHIIDYSEMTFHDLKGIIISLFSGKIADITEKIDGTNIQASMNDDGEVVFVRNKGDLNSEHGGMSIQDMVAKWAKNAKVQQTFVESGKVLEQIFQKVGKKFFNPTPDTRIFANCECMIEGTTNIMPYVSSKVNVHDLWVYTKTDDGYELKEVTKNGLSTLEKAMDDIDSAQITPNVIVKVTEESKTLLNKYLKAINDLYRGTGLKDSSTIDEYERSRFAEYMGSHYDWYDNSKSEILYNRFILQDKSVNIRDLKGMFPGHEDDIADIDKKGYKEIYQYVMHDIDILFLQIGNSIIDLCDGFINKGHEKEVVGELTSNILDVSRAMISGDYSTDTKTKFARQLDRLIQLDGIKATEGIVFRYKGKLMKCTGAFAPLNQALGTRFQK